ncbi:MAG TPA: universal stress protein, partial [Gemmatimonadales bacterium]|nr:universal stress protein [Gemmatimonadales bacterium]
RVRLMHVVEPMRFTQLLPDQWDAVAYDRGSREMFDRFSSRFKAVAQEDHVVRTGLPAEAIATEAGDWQADVVVVGSHGKGWVDRILVGSTTQRLVTELPTSIMVVPVKAARSVRAGAKAPRGTRKHRLTRRAKTRR